MVEGAEALGELLPQQLGRGDPADGTRHLQRHAEPGADAGGDVLALVVGEAGQRDRVLVLALAVGEVVDCSVCSTGGPCSSSASVLGPTISRKSWTTSIPEVALIVLRTRCMWAWATLMPSQYGPSMRGCWPCRKRETCRSTSIRLCPTVPRMTRCPRPRSSLIRYTSRFSTPP